MKKFSLRLWPRTADQHEQLQGDEPSVLDGIDSGKRFGIKSYLNQFYLSSPTIDEQLENPGTWYLLPPPPIQRMSSYVCRVITLIGLLLLLAGAGFIIVGYTWKAASGEDLDTEITRISITQNEDGDFYIDKSRLDELLHQNDKLKVSGFIIFALGALVVAISLVVPTCVHFFARNSKRLPFSDDNTPNEPPIRIYPSVGSRFKVTSSKVSGPQKVSPTSGPVPVMQEISSVQPANKRSAGNSPTADQLLMAIDSDALLP